MFCTGRFVSSFGLFQSKRGWTWPASCQRIRDFYLFHIRFSCSYMRLSRDFVVLRYRVFVAAAAGLCTALRQVIDRRILLWTGRCSDILRQFTDRAVFVWLLTIQSMVANE